MSSACIRMSGPTLTRRSSPRSSMRRMVFVDTRSAVAASATVSKRATGDGLVRTALPPAEPIEQCDPGPGGGSLGSLRSNVSAAQEGILPATSDVASQTVLRRDAAGRSSTGNSARALPMPLYYSARQTSPIPKPTDYVGRIRHQRNINTSLQQQRAHPFPSFWSRSQTSPKRTTSRFCSRRS
jgi:hypothetical protein